MSDPTPDRNKPSVAGSIVILVIGLLILVPSGLCTGFFAFAPLFTGGSGDSGLLGLALLIGGPFVAVGIALVLWGIRRLRR
jgi:hypothetical protein